jgi:serine/threonine protein kinase
VTLLGPSAALRSRGLTNSVEPHAESGGHAQHDALLGTLVAGHYRVIRRIGQGGMGAVYEVTRDEERAAIKFITGNGKQLDSRALKRFQREAALAAEIVHPNVTRTFEFGHDDELGAPFFVMELLAGRDLGAVLQELAPLEPAVCAKIGAQAARGLSAAHSRGVVHRDVKPHNLFLHGQQEVTVKVCDFGVAKLAEPARQGDDSSLTHSGGIIGSPRYMSPEQAQGAKDLDERTDVWSLCASLFEALSGRRLWEAETLGEIIVAICTKPIPRLTQVAPWVPPALAATVHRGLERDKEARWPTMHELEQALDQHTDGANAMNWDDLTQVPEAARRSASHRSVADVVTRADNTYAPAAVAIAHRTTPVWGVMGVVLALAAALAWATLRSSAGSAQQSGSPIEGPPLAESTPSTLRPGNGADESAQPPTGSSGTTPSSAGATNIPLAVKELSVPSAVHRASGVSRTTQPPKSASAAARPSVSAATLPTREDWK